MCVDSCGVFSPGFLAVCKATRRLPPPVLRVGWSLVLGPEGSFKLKVIGMQKSWSLALVFLDPSHFSNLRGFILRGSGSVPPQ